MDSTQDRARPIQAQNGVVARLMRWEQFGAVWQVIARDDSQLTISLCRCDGGEEVDRITAADPEVLAFIGHRSTSEQSR